jgi:putative flippase GtrA
MKRAMIGLLRLQLIRYIFFGSLGTLLDLASFVSLIGSDVPYFQANMISISLGITLSYFLNTRYTFKAEIELKNILLFYSVGFAGVIFSSAFLWCILNLTGVATTTAKLISLPLVAGLQFTLNKRVTFK